jgi:multisubunit Na+/H+ antiporter MnhG subunit
MSAAQWAIDILLLVSLAVTAFSCVALVFVSGFLNRLHYLGPVTSVSITLLLAAVIMQYGWGQAAIKTFLVWFVLLLINAVLAHATARAARVRDLGHWTPDPKEKVPGMGGRRA